MPMGQGRRLTNALIVLVGVLVVGVVGYLLLGFSPLDGVPDGHHGLDSRFRRGQAAVPTGYGLHHR